MKTTPAELLGYLNETEKKNSPKELYISGDISIIKTGCRVAVVGSRKPSLDGVSRAARLVKSLVEHGAVIVSGLAEGIDTVAHKTAIENKGKTIAVIGNPLDVSYPRSNAALQQFISERHLLISQFPTGYPITKKNFIMRNRTMALICDISIIIEAGDTSGSLSQGWEALRLGRRLMFLESLLQKKEITWPLKMTEYGAEVLSNSNFDDILDSLPERFPEMEKELAF